MASNLHLHIKPSVAEARETERCTSDSTQRWIFVRGLHHSGTTLVFDLLALHPSVGALNNGGRYEDEGQHLQHVFPTVGSRNPIKSSPSPLLTHASRDSDSTPTSPRTHRCRGNIYLCPNEYSKVTRASREARIGMKTSLCEVMQWQPEWRKEPVLLQAFTCIPAATA